MPIEITMPALSPTMVEGNLTKWLKKEGDKVAPGEVIAEIETDKATMEVESVDEGIIGKILVSQGSKNVKVNTVIALLLEEGEDKKSLGAYKAKSEKEKSDKPATLEQDNKEQKKNADTGANQNNANVGQAVGFTAPPIVPIIANKIVKKSLGGQQMKASPLAKKIAADSGININRLSGTGPEGRVVKEDVEAALRTGITAGRGGVIERNQDEQIHVENSSMRQVIANRLLQSKQHIPHFYLNLDCNIDKLLALRQDLNNVAPIYEDQPAYKISVNDMVIKAAALALRDVKEVNASWTNDIVIQYTNVDISVAVAVKDGLITPIVRNADQESVQAISIEMKKLAAKAQAGTLSLEEFQGGGFSISNLGMYGIKEFKAIINPPQSCIMAVGAGEQRAIVRDGDIEIATMMSISISCDHRIVDGVVGAKFLNVFKNYIEQPLQLIL